MPTPKLHRALLALAALAGLLLGPGASAQRAVPYWASIATTTAKMRAGPGKQYPSTWIYRRDDLPVKVLRVMEDWRQVEDPDGTQGWMSRTQLSDTRTAMVRTLTTVHDQPSASAHINWRVEPGVVGRLGDCDAGWCQIDLGGRVGHIRERALWGVGAP